MDRIGILLSSAYIDGSLEVEFGRIPSAFIPFKNQRLYFHQVKFLKDQNCSKIYLYLPIGYQLPSFDEGVLSELGVDILYSSPHYSAFQAYQKVLLDLYNGKHSCEFLFLFGDTHIEISHLIKNQTLLINKANYNYKWSRVDDSGFVNVGCFAISIDQQVIEKTFESGSQSYDQYFSFLVENSINLEKDFKWYDFGHLFTYYESLTNDFILREFNEIKYLNGVINKSSSDAHKIELEINWYQDLPNRMKIYSPRMIEYSIGESASYAMEYIRAPTLSSLAVFCNLPLDQWDIIFKSLFQFICNSRVIGFDPPNNFLEIVSNKTMERISEEQSNHRLISDHVYENLMNMVATVNMELNDSYKSMPAYTHGDLCFTNIMFDSKSQAIKCIDPRGRQRCEDGHSFSDFDDSHYDLAKLVHSIFGGYDLIINNRYYLDRQCADSIELPDLDSKQWISLQEMFQKRCVSELGLDAFKSAYLLSIHLFISMIPLHYDSRSRQSAFLRNAFRLFEARNQWF